MSSILKALRKLEEEKARRNGGSPDIARDILKSGRRQKRSAPWSASVLGVFVIVSGVTAYVLMEKPVYDPLPMGAGKNIDNAPTANTAYLVRETPVVGVDSQPAAQSVDRTHSTSSEPGINTQGQPPSRPSRKVTAAKAVPGPVRETPSLAVEEKGASDESLPSLLLSGIAYQEDRGTRLAIVNDLPVMEGTMIEGARVEEIFQDRVRFVYAGRSFHVSLGQSTATR